MANDKDFGLIVYNWDNFQLQIMKQDHPFGTRFDMNFIGNDIFFDPWWMEDTINSVNRNFGGLNPAIYRVFLNLWRNGSN
ncbi:hypothetical protein PVAND_001258 [Polypedilum vanderplanki]|uniref:Uncharacterized protein n=1 Tax=Polypedilum vanderplanki TaxID=319348 RepID=A0A9J6BMU1_POLVA|nr:hypothetical protein PVAND_001258 [Polypedilum vanderplanki]